jgi:hypothetical protein
MQYAEYSITCYEAEPARWRAVVVRMDGRGMMMRGSIIPSFTPDRDATTRENAIILAKAAVDSGVLQPAH